MTTMPAQKPHRSRQDYATPPEFMAAVKNLLGISKFDIDLAADDSNHKADVWLHEAMNSLSADWPLIMANRDMHGWAWLNPPFSNIEPWAQKCWESGIKIAFLVPAAVDSNWYRDWVDGKAYVFNLNGRISFDGVGPYPKDCILAIYGTRFKGEAVWNWREELATERTEGK